MKSETASLGQRRDPSLVSKAERLLKLWGGNGNHLLEYGAGVTTQLLSDFIDSQSAGHEALLLSIETDLRWLDHVCGTIERRPFHYLLAPGAAGTEQSAANVELLAKMFPDMFDLVFIHADSAFECLPSAAITVRSAGTVIVHDPQARFHQHARDLFHHVIGEEEFLILQQPHSAARLATMRSAKKHERRGIVVPIQGPQGGAQWDIARPWTEAYAQKVGAELLAVEVPSAIPVMFLKFYAAQQATAFDRILMLDSDILIRPHAPDVFDVVPSTHLGAMAEGRLFPRSAWIEQSGQFYGPADMQESDYFNAGVLVLNRDTLRQLFQVPEHMLASPGFEQDYLNWTAAQARIPRYDLPIQFNYIPNAKYLSLDWRHAFFYHFAGAGKRRYRNRTALFMRGRFNDGTGWRRDVLFSRHLRTFLMRVADLQYRGRQIIGFDPDDMRYKQDCSIAVLEDENAYMMVRKGRGIGAYGPYTSLEQGRYRVRTITSQLALELGGRDICVDITAEMGRKILLPPTSIEFDQDAVAELPDIAVEETMNKVEFRLHRSKEALRLVMGFEVELLRQR